MVKKVGTTLLFALLLGILVSCSGGSYVVGVGEINASQLDLSGEYTSFSGHYFKKVKIKEGETLTVTFSADTENGQLVAKVIDTDENVVDTLAVGDTISINKSGQFKLQVEGEKHKGNFNLSWDIQ